MPYYPESPGPDRPGTSITPANATAMPTPIELRYDRTPTNRQAMLRSLLARRPAQAPLHTLDVCFHAQWNGAQVDSDALRSYMALCDDANASAWVCVPPAPAPYFTFALPLLYVHAMAMPLHMAILTHPKFPLRLLGLVHWANQTEMLKPIDPGALLDFECTMEGIATSERGQMFDIHTTVRTGGEVAWREISTFLSPARRSKQTAQVRPRATDDAPIWGDPVAQWEVAADAGRKFAGPSGDWNPIHISAVTARMFGYPRAIAHGLFSAARCLSLLQAGKPQVLPVRLDLRFKRPLHIPGSVALHTASDGNATLFVLRVQPGGEPHIEGRLTAA
jgi:acyl dehydratase